VDRRAEHGGSGRAAAGVTLVTILAAACAAGCSTFKAYEGPARPMDQVAVVRADPVINAGLPVQVILRSVDGRKVKASHSAVSVMPGVHHFLADCWLQSTGGATRFDVEGEVEAGREYRLEAEASAQTCNGISLILRSP
jgi:hypothetical protein